MGWSRFFRRARWDRERSAEIESYIQMETDENLGRGMAPEEAHAAARRKFGNRTLVQEQIYHMNTIALLDTIVHDLRHALRSFRHNPGFTTIAVLTLAIGIGANSAVFSVVNSVLLEPLRYPKPEQLVAVRQFAPGAPGLASFSDGLRLSASMYFTYAEQNRSFQSLGVWGMDTANVTGLAEPEQVRVAYVSDGVLEALGTRPALGRWLDRSDQAPHGPRRVMLSYGYWQRRFGGRRTVIGQSLQVDSSPREIVGVMPPRFQVVNADFDLIVPLALDRGKAVLPGFGFRAVARLKRAVSIAQADADIGRMLPIWMRSWPMPFGGNPRVYERWRITPAIRPLQQEVVGSIGDVLWVLMGTIGLVMLIACANVTNLLLVRAEARRQELALRAALGAGTARIVRAVLTESVLLGMLGGAVGTALAYAGLRLLVNIGPADLPRLSEISMDPRAFGFTLAVSLLAGLLLGSIPALRYAGPRISASLRSAGRTASASRERHRARNLLVVAQVALALVLLVSAGLMIRTFQAMRKVEPGFTNPEQLQTLRISIPDLLVADPREVTRTQNNLVDKLAALPGVSSVGFASQMPMEGLESNWDSVYAEGKSYRPEEIPPLRFFLYVSPGLFHTTGTRLIAGRELTWTDVYGVRPVVMVSENLAREFWGTPSAALGKRLRELPGTPWREVIGVIEDVREKGVEEKAPEIVYWPTMMPNLFGPGPLDAERTVTFAIRTRRAGTAAFLDEVRRAVWSVNASLPVASARTMQEIYERSLGRASFALVMLAIAGTMALMLGLIGIYGVIAYAVSQRRREIGIRVALGAEPGELRRMFVRHALGLAGIGAAIGLGGAAGLTRVMQSLLFGISALDPPTYAAVPLVLIAAAGLASYVPARRAAAVDPAEVLKAE